MRFWFWRCAKEYDLSCMTLSYLRRTYFHAWAGKVTKVIKKTRANLANIVTLWDCPCRVPAYDHRGPLLSRGSKQDEKMRANDNFQDIITLCDVLCLWLSRSLCPWWSNLHNQQIPPQGRHQSTGCIKIVFIIFLGPISIWFGMVCYIWYVIWCLMLVLWSSLITKLVGYLTWKNNKSENRKHHIMCSCAQFFCALFFSVCLKILPCQE